MKRVGILLFLFVFLCSLSSCAFISWEPIFRYDGDEIALDVAAIYSIPGVESYHDDQIFPMEIDQYGRKIFAVCLNRVYAIPSEDLLSSGCMIGIIIMQKNDEKSVSFYQTNNYLAKVIEKTEINKETVINSFSEEEIDKLKEQNDWNQPLSEDEQMITVPLATDKNVKKTKTHNGTFKQVVGTNCLTSFYRKTKGENEIWFVMNKDDYKWYLIATNSNGNLLHGEKSVFQMSGLQGTSEMQSFLDANQ